MTMRICVPVLTSIALLAEAPVTAQLLPSVGGGGPGGLGGVGQTAGDLARPVVEGALGSGATDILLQERALANGAFDRVDTLVSSVAASPASLLDLRRARLKMLINANRRELDSDGAGNPVRRDRLIALDPPAAMLAVAARGGFRTIADERDPVLGLRTVTLAVPPRMNVRRALDRLRQLAPGLDADFDHVFEPAGGSLSPTSVLLAAGAAGAAPAGTRIAMIDGGVASHPSLTRASIEQKGFAGAAEATGHGTAVASLLVGDERFFKGAARGAKLFVGDVYGGSPAAGSASAIVRALGWAASKRPRIVNISLVGPANRAVGRAIALLRNRGIAVAAAVGNDGPAAPVQYPAGYDGVIAVTGVDARGRALVEAGKARHLDFAAPGADMAAAVPGKGYMPVRGTSFAAPLVAARFAATGSIGGLAAEAQPGKGKVGRGVVCGSCRIDPKAFRR